MKNSKAQGKPHSLQTEGIYAPGGQDAPHSPSGNLQWTASDEAMGYLLQRLAFLTDTPSSQQIFSPLHTKGQ